MIGLHDRGGLIAELSGDHAKAVEAHLAALEVVADQIVGIEAWHRGRLAGNYAHLGRLDDAAEQVDRARALLTEHDGWDAALAVLGVAEAVVASASGRHGEAEAQFAEAYRALTDLAATLGVIRCLVEWGRARAAAGEAEGAGDRLDAAAEVLERIGAGRDWFAYVDRHRPRP